MKTANIFLSLSILCMAVTAHATDPLPFKMPKLSEAKTNNLQDFARVGFNVDELETWSDPAMDDLKERVASLEEKLDALVAVKSKKTKTVQRIVRYEQTCDEFGNCTRQPVYESVEIPIDEPSEDIVMLGSQQTYQSSGLTYTNPANGYTYSPPQTTAVSQRRTRTGSPCFSVDSTGTVYRVARIRTFFRQLFNP